MMRDIVVLAGSTPWSVLSLCKCACKHGVKAYVICVRNEWGRKYAHSRFVFKAYDAPEASLREHWILFFKENSFKEKPILFVTNDYVCQIVDKDRDFYEEHFVVCMASSYIIDTFIDKNRATVEAEKNGLIIPKTRELHDATDLEGICQDFAFPVILKPVTFRDHSAAGFKTHLCKTEEHLRGFVAPYLEGKINIQCQEFIIGEDKDCLFYQFFRDSEGNVTECMGEKTLQTNGIMTIGTTKYDEFLATMCRAFLQRIDYVGIGGLEFKRNGGKYYFIEMSTRTEGFLPISDMSGVSLAEASFNSLNGGNFQETHQEDGMRYGVFLSLFLSTLRSKGFFSACKSVFSFLLSPKSRFAGSFLDFWFSLKLDLKILR